MHLRVQSPKRHAEKEEYVMHAQISTDGYILKIYTELKKKLRSLHEVIYIYIIIYIFKHPSICKTWAIRCWVPRLVHDASNTSRSRLQLLQAGSKVWPPMAVSKNRGGPPKPCHFNRVFYYKPSILGFTTPIFGNTPFGENVLNIEDKMYPIPVPSI